LKITLSDKKTIGAFLKKVPFDGRGLTTDGTELRASWGGGKLVAKWDKKGKLVRIPSDDKGAKRVQALLPEI